MIASSVNFSCPSRSCASRGALTRTPMVSTMPSMSARGSPAASTGSCAPTSSTMSARVNAALSMRVAARRCAPDPMCAPKRGAARHAPRSAHHGPAPGRAHRRATAP